MSLYMASTWGSWRLGTLPVGVAAAAWGYPLAVGIAAAVLLAALIPIGRSKSLWSAENPPAALGAVSSAPAEPDQPEPEHVGARDG